MIFKFQLAKRYTKKEKTPTKKGKDTYKCSQSLRSLDTTKKRK